MHEFNKLLIATLGETDGPKNENGKVPPKRRTNAEIRPREYLTSDEVDALIKAAGSVGRNRARDKCIILTAYRHALRVSELVALQWSQIDFRNAQMHVNRVKGGTPAVHPIRNVEVRALKTLRAKSPHAASVFVSELGTALTTRAVHKIIQRAGGIASLGFTVHPHMLRHACGFTLANEGQDTRAIQAYMGHRNIQHTVRYTELSPARFDSFFKGTEP